MNTVGLPRMKPKRLRKKCRDGDAEPLRDRAAHRTARSRCASAARSTLTTRVAMRVRPLAAWARRLAPRRRPPLLDRCPRLPRRSKRQPRVRGHRRRDLGERRARVEPGRERLPSRAQPASARRSRRRASCPRAASMARADPLHAAGVVGERAVLLGEGRARAGRRARARSAASASRPARSATRRLLDAVEHRLLAGTATQIALPTT